MWIKDKKAVSSVILIAVILAVGTTILFAYHFLKGISPKGACEITFATIYKEESGETWLSISLSNTGTIDLTLKEIKVGEEVVTLPAEGVKGTNFLKAGTDEALIIPLKGTYEIGTKALISVTTDPEAAIEDLEAAVEVWLG